MFKIIFATRLLSADVTEDSLPNYQRRFLVLAERSASVPIPKFASLSGALVCELRNQRDTSNLLILVWLWFRSRHDGLVATMMRTSEPPH